jgi:hypothetical protein
MLNPVGAVIALSRSALVRIDVKSVVWTGLHAGLATDAAIIVEVDDTIFSSEECCSWANRGTWGVFAVIATMY